MDTSTDVFGLNNQEFMKKLESLSSVKNSQNILTVQDDVLFIWNQSNFRVLTFNLKMMRDRPNGRIEYQSLLGTQPISFSVELIRVNTVLSLISLSGPHGVCVMELPRRSGAYGGFGNGRDVVYCRNHFLDERLFTCSKYVECKQVRWHPGSPNDNHLLVLTSENLIRIYNIETGEGSNLERTLTIGKKPSGTFGTSKVPFLVALGETGVDFDFAPPEIPSGHLKKTFENLRWPIYILRGNGDIYTVTTAIRGGVFEDAVLRGPLRMHPAADDNYGVDACAILCLQSTPTVIAISTCTGTIYHCIALSSDDDTSEWGDTDEPARLADKSLYVFECIELELGLTESESGFTCPIFFHHDLASKSRYFCSHDTGIHCITVPVVTSLKQFLEDSEFEITPSLAEYIVCTYAGSEGFNPVLGIAIIYNPAGLIALLGSGSFLSLPLTSVEFSRDFNDKPDTSIVVSPTKKILKQPFDEYIRSFLKPTLSQPILQLPKKVMNLELLQRATQTFQDEHFKKLERVREEIVKRVKALRMLRRYQEDELSRLEMSKEEATMHAENIAERYEMLKERQVRLEKRVEGLLRMTNTKQPVQSKSEANHAKELEHCFDQLKRFKAKFEEVKLKQQFQAKKIQQWKAQQQTEEKYLGSIQTETIKSSLSMMTGQIGDMKKDIELCKQDIGLQ